MIVDSEDKKLLIVILTEKLLSTYEFEEKERILRLLQRMKKRSLHGFKSRSEVAAHFGITRKKLYHDILQNEQLLEELLNTGWTKDRIGFYPRQISVLQKYLGL